MTGTIMLNGDPAEVQLGDTVRALLERLGTDPRRVVVEHNRSILRGDELDSTTLAAGDELEVLQLVGGGA